MGDDWYDDVMAVPGKERKKRMKTLQREQQNIEFEKKAEQEAPHHP